MRPAITLAILTIAALPSPGFGQEAKYGCSREITGFLQSVGLTKDKIDRRQDLTEYTPAQRRRVVGLHVWIWPKDCDGRFIVDLNTACQVTNTYSTGDCRFEGQDHAE